MHRSLTRTLTLFGILAAAASALHAQDSFLDHWQARVNSTQAEQPHWVTPLVTVTPRLEQEFRTDFVRQVTPTHLDTWNYGNGKGLELIPTRHIELIFNVPPYIQHNSPSIKTKDGFGDVSFLLKYRFLASNEEKHNYILTAFVGGSLPTGSYSNGSTDASVSPTLAAGKGIGKFDIQSTIGTTLPVANGEKIGRPVLWNNALQWKANPHWWPEVEFNSTWYHAGDNDGKMQNFVTPGIVGRFPLHHRIGLTMGAGMQIATSSFHSYDHGLVFTARMPF
ncbi:hypothetical protein [Silvibacterium dinghuense]|nr:hypothetical protein [Silvibacterium dinghuense]GGH08002.1 hypothetical protein GCM10011586_25370 [Silvibacterium dinghuense]